MTALITPRFFSQDLPCNYSPVRKLAVFHSEPSRSSLAGISYQSTELSSSRLLNSATTTTASLDSSTPFHMFGPRQGGLDHCGDVFPRTLPRAIQDRPDSHEVLFSRFREQICPMLSFTVGQNNLWQTWILPLTRSSESLPHAISAITALHASTLTANVQLYIHGEASIIESFRILNRELSRPKFEISALATILLLASWARWNGGFGQWKTHLNGAFAVLQKISSPRQYIEWKSSFANIHRFLLLASTFLHMDALSDLVQSTISGENPRSDPKFRELIRRSPLILRSRVWCLPLDRWSFGFLIPVEFIYLAADLCYEVRMATITSDVITKAETLKREVEQFSRGSMLTATEVVHPSDLDKQCAVHTAEAYRYATLLFLHQVMPDIFGMTSSQYLARATVNHLSRSPPSPSVIFTQIYPLFVAGCEASTKQEQEWVKERWAVMAARMRVTNVDNCWKITQEVWRRRDAYRQLRSENAQGVADNIDDMDPEFSVKGRLHWAAVMKDWDCVVSF